MGHQANHQEDPEVTACDVALLGAWVPAHSTSVHVQGYPAVVAQGADDYA